MRDRKRIDSNGRGGRGAGRMGETAINTYYVGIKTIFNERETN